jgi:hypothetical protein
MELSWSYLIGIVIVVCAAVGLGMGRLDPKDFITCVGLVLSFLSGKTVGEREALRRAGRGGR